MFSPVKGVPLNSVVKGRRLIITHVPDGHTKVKLIRFGILGGELIRCLERLPGGTVVIEKNRQEIAIGAELATSIRVSYAGGDEYSNE
ncbi:MAG: ferrous iron transport protein A [Deltaproteobacteria bacterium]|nr:ferrous iron transport protein A [Deltaproteobacteria bacterium]